MTSPDGFIPNGGSGGSGDTQGVSDWLGQGLNVTVTDVDNFHDEQLDLNNRVEYLEGVAGFGVLFLGQNWNISGQKRITLPFNTQLGPEKAVAPVGGNSWKFLTKGLWRVGCHVSFMPPSTTWWQGSTVVNIAVYIKAYLITSGTSAPAYTEKRYDIAVTSVGPETAAFPHTFVVPEDGLYAVCVQVEHPKAATIGMYGGTLRSALTVNKWDNRTTNNVVLPTVPDGGTLS